MTIHIKLFQHGEHVHCHGRIDNSSPSAIQDGGRFRSVPRFWSLGQCHATVVVVPLTNVVIFICHTTTRGVAQGKSTGKGKKRLYSRGSRGVKSHCSAMRGPNNCRGVPSVPVLTSPRRPWRRGDFRGVAKWRHLDVPRRPSSDFRVLSVRDINCAKNGNDYSYKIIPTRLICSALEFLPI